MAVVVTVTVVVFPGVVVGEPQGVATARRGRARREKAAARENMISECEGFGFERVTDCGRDERRNATEKTRWRNSRRVL